MNPKYVWPGLMLAASVTNITGFSIAILAGQADNTVAFKTSLATSTSYAVAQLAGMRSIYLEDKRTHAERIARERELREIVIQR